MTSEKTFISYSWTTPEHEAWVLNFAEELVSAGVDVILDKWELKEGHDLIGFMERMVTDPDVKKVIMVCDKLYVEKADGRSGGVGTETQIISRKVYENQTQDKFVAVVVEKDGDEKPCLPTYYKSRMYIDLSPDSDFPKNHERLLRWIYNKPLFVKPQLGEMPQFLSETEGGKIVTGINFRRAAKAIKGKDENSHIDIDYYFKNVIEELPKIKLNSGAPPQEILKNIESTIPLRNEISHIFELISTYNISEEIITKTTSFFEQLASFFNPKQGHAAYYTSDFDNYKFLANELFIILISSLIRSHRYEEARTFIKSKYYIENIPVASERLCNYSIFFNHLESLEEVNSIAEKKYHSLHGKLLVDRAIINNEKPSQLIQADFICYLHHLYLAENDYDRSNFWFPLTILDNYRYGHALEIFERGEEKKYFYKMSKIFSNDGKLFFHRIRHKLDTKAISPSAIHGRKINPLMLMNYEKLDSQ